MIFSLDFHSEYKHVGFICYTEERPGKLIILRQYSIQWREGGNCLFSKIGIWNPRFYAGRSAYEILLKIYDIFWTIALNFTWGFGKVISGQWIWAEIFIAMCFLLLLWIIALQAKIEDSEIVTFIQLQTYTDGSAHGKVTMMGVLVR